MKINLQNSKQFQAARAYTLKHNNKDLNRSLELAEKYQTDVAIGVFIKKYWWARKKDKADSTMTSRQFDNFLDKYYHNLKGCFYDYFEHDYNFRVLPERVYKFMNKLHLTPETLKYNMDHRERF
jgi:hypothetical protein|nr:MAG TPA: hypothetical protein [Caudoviricetes sp.]